MGKRLLLLAAACAAGLVLAATAAAALDTYDGVSFHPFTMDHWNMDCAPWTEPGIGPTMDCDPVNVLFPGQGLSDVVARLHAAGWADTDGTTQWLDVGDATLAPVQAQLQVPDGTDPTQRYHVRLWQVGDLTLGNVHHEHGSPHHIDLAWDAAEAFLANALCSTWCQQAPLPAQAAIQGPGSLWRGWGNDGVATVVPVAPPPPPPPPVVSHSAPARPAAKPRRRPRRRSS